MGLQGGNYFLKRLMVKRRQLFKRWRQCTSDFDYLSTLDIHEIVDHKTQPSQTGKNLEQEKLTRQLGS